MKEELEKRIKELRDIVDSTYSGKLREKSERRLKVLVSFYSAMYGENWED